MTPDSTAGSDDATGRAAPESGPAPGDGAGAVAPVFWGLVARFNLGILGVSVGLMLIGFEGAWRLGGAALAVGLVLTGHGLHRYRSYVRGRARSG